MNKTIISWEQLQKIKKRPKKYALPNALYELHNVRLTSSLTGELNDSILREIDLPLGDTVSVCARVHSSQDEDSSFTFINVYASGEMADLLEQEIELNNLDTSYTIVAQCKIAEKKEIQYYSEGDFLSTKLVIVFILKDMVSSHK